VEQYTGRGTTSNTFGYAHHQISRNLGCGYNNQSRGGHINQAAAQLLSDFISNRIT
jgi:hypothetical protein